VCRLLDAGAGPNDLVIALAIPFSKALEYCACWSRGKVVGRNVKRLKAYIVEIDRLEAVGWDPAGLQAAWENVTKMEQAISDDGGYPLHPALDLLKAVRTRFPSYSEALRALQNLPRVQEQERREATAKWGQQQAEGRVAATRQELEQVQREISRIKEEFDQKHAPWQMLTKTLVEAIRGRPKDFTNLYSWLGFAVRDLPVEDAAGLTSVPGTPAASSSYLPRDVRRELAEWVTRLVPDLVMYRSDAAEAKARARAEASSSLTEVDKVSWVLAGQMMSQAVFTQAAQQVAAQQTAYPVSPTPSRIPPLQGLSPLPPVPPPLPQTTFLMKCAIARGWTPRSAGRLQQVRVPPTPKKP
jgi:hypothetical protein